jgi:hypothetical protein
MVRNMQNKQTARSALGLLLCLLGSAGCATFAVATAPSKHAAKDTSDAALSADRAFWSAFHGGHYDDIGAALEELEAVYLAHPNDPNTAAHIGFLHAWRVSERRRLPKVPASVTDDVVLARRYFAEAVTLAPDDARFRGFLASMTLAEGNIHGDAKLVRRGFYDLGDAVDAWPEFNLFTRGYVLSQLPFDDPAYTTAVDDQWKNLDACVGKRVDRSNPDLAAFLAEETHEGPKRACWNSWIAPHNFEGFFLNMGDMIVKAGDPQTARKLYAQAKLSKGYDAWPYKDALERRLVHADENVAVFRAKPSTAGESGPMIATPFACMGCHQE